MPSTPPDSATISASAWPSAPSKRSSGAMEQSCSAIRPAQASRSRVKSGQLIRASGR